MRLTVSGLLLIFASTLHAQGEPVPIPTQAQTASVGIAVVTDQPGSFPLVDPRATPGSQPIQSGGVVAASELRIPSKALKELERSQKAYLAGDIRSSVGHLEKAVLIHPPFLQAHNVLGARYLQLGDYERGLNEFQKAVDIDPKFAYGYHNLSVTAYFLHRYAEAEAAARLALRLDPQQATTRYLLGGILFAEQKNIPEAAELFRQSVEKFPNARLYLARIAQKNGDANQAAAELQTYLNMPEADNRQKAACWLAQLTHSQAGPGCIPEKTIP